MVSIGSPVTAIIIIIIIIITSFVCCEVTLTQKVFESKCRWIAAKVSSRLIGAVVAISSVVVSATVVRRVWTVSAAVARAAVVVVRTTAGAVVTGGAGARTAVDHRHGDDDHEDTDDHSGDGQPVRRVAERVGAPWVWHRRTARHYYSTHVIDLNNMNTQKTIYRIIT